MATEIQKIKAKLEKAKKEYNDFRKANPASLDRGEDSSRASYNQHVNQKSFDLRKKMLGIERELETAQKKRQDRLKKTKKESIDFTIDKYLNE
jgi:hypothetical protein